MSDLDNKNAWATDDGKADDIELINDEIDTTIMVAETTGQSSLKTKIRTFLKLFAVEKKEPDFDCDQWCWLGQEQKLLDLCIQGKTIMELWYSKKHIFIYD